MRKRVFRHAVMQNASKMDTQMPSHPFKVMTLREAPQRKLNCQAPQNEAAVPLSSLSR